MLIVAVEVVVVARVLTVSIVVAERFSLVVVGSERLAHTHCSVLSL